MTRRLVIHLAAWLAMAAAVQAQKVSSPLNKHNLSTSGPGPVKATTMTEICVFCHTPHNANPAVPLWNQTLSSGVTYSTYTSTTMTAAVGLPSGSSKLCLSCHDGTVAIGSTINSGRIPVNGVNAQGQLTGSSVVGPTLTDDHPISFVPVAGAEIVTPPAGDKVKLDGAGQVQCASCHDPHEMGNDPTVKKFLVKANSASALCLTCHSKAYWSSDPSSHQTSTKSYTALQGAHTGYTTVAANGCESCHKPHTATVAARSLKAAEEASCGTGTGGQCHGSSGVANYNITAEFNKTYRHPTYSTTPSVHDASESPSSVNYRMPETLSTTARHAECPDCHNPHAAYSAAATAPKGSGKLAGVWGVDSNGLLVLPSGAPPSVREYEICYKCHGDSANKPQPNGQPYGPYPTRNIVQFSMRLMFDAANPSFHPIEAAGRSTWVPSLKAPWTTASIIYCTDCHGNDTGPRAYPTVGTGPNGVHGSNLKHLLVARYDMDTDNISESATVYALCYKCHDRTSILADTSFRYHNLHIVSVRAPCSDCHDPHGISSTQGTTANNARLINFDRRYVTASSGIVRFTQTQQGSGTCQLICHNQNHNPYTY